MLTSVRVMPANDEELHIISFLYVNTSCMQILIDGLANFEHRHFTKNFLIRMKKEIKLAVEHANKDYY